MKPLTVTKKTIRKIKAWNKLTKSTGKHFPFVRVKEVRSPGRRYEHYCVKQNRIIHLLSDGEYRTYKKLTWMTPNTIRVNEQVPLDLIETMNIAQEEGVMHPRDYKKNTANVMTTDFVVTELNPETGEVKDTAYSFKYWKSIYKNENGKVVPHKKRTWQKLDLEKKYWNKKNVEYKILTERDALKNEIYNIDLFLTEYYKNIDRSLLITFTEKFINLWNTNPHNSLEQLLHSLSQNLNVDKSDAFTLFKHAAIKKLLPIEISKSKIMLYKKVGLR